MDTSPTLYKLDPMALVKTFEDRDPEKNLRVIKQITQTWDSDEACSFLERLMDHYKSVPKNAEWLNYAGRWTISRAVFPEVIMMQRKLDDSQYYWSGPLDDYLHSFLTNQNMLKPSTAAVRFYRRMMLTEQHWVEFAELIKASAEYHEKVNMKLMSNLYKHAYSYAPEGAERLVEDAFSCFASEVVEAEVPSSYVGKVLAALGEADG